MITVKLLEIRDVLAEKQVENRFAVRFKSDSYGINIQEGYTEDNLPRTPQEIADEMADLYPETVFDQMTWDGFEFNGKKYGLDDDGDKVVEVTDS